MIIARSLRSRRKRKTPLASMEIYVHSIVWMRCCICVVSASSRLVVIEPTCVGVVRNFQTAQHKKLRKKKGKKKSLEIYPRTNMHD